MNKFIFAIYRVVVPKPVRTIFLKKSLRKKIIRYYRNLPGKELNADMLEVVEYLEKNPLSIFPYPFEHNYSPDHVEVMTDVALRMRYVMFEGKKLFFKKRWNKKRIGRACSDLMREQDVNSPHRYLVPGFDISENDVIADIGAAEGNFSLSVIERVKKAYIFEYSREWAGALNATFSPYKHKAEIINKMVSGSDDESNVRLDTFLKERPDVTFIKIDVDGVEQKVLNSCMMTLRGNRQLKIALCTYHRANDENDFTRLLRDCGFEVAPSKGYMIHFYDKRIGAPWLRRGLIRAVRNDSTKKA